MVSVPPRPSVVISLVSWLTPWNPATMTMWPLPSASVMRPGVTSMIFALPCTPSVMTPAWLPVNERALNPRSEIAMATSAIEIRSPAVISMSSSRGGGTGLTSLGEVEQVVGGVPHRRDGHDDVVAGLLRLGDPPGDPLDALGVGQRRSAVLLDDDGHVLLP